MKIKDAFFYLFIILINTSCCEWTDSCKDPDEPTYEEAISTINSFKSNLMSSAGPNSIQLKSFQSARVGEVWILHQCKSTIQNFSTSLLEKFSGNNYTIIEDNIISKTYSFHWQNSWTKNHEISADINYEPLETILEAALEYSEIQSVDFNISLKNPKYLRINNISELRNEYENYLISEEILAEGNIIISALIKGKMYIEYKALGINNNKLKIDLSAGTNKLFEKLLFKPDYKYFNERSATNGFSVLEESGENDVVFAIEYFKISNNLQDMQDINEKVEKFCGSDETLVRVKNVNGYCITSKINLIDLQIEAGASGDELFFFWKNLSDIPITNFLYTLIIRNRNGQILKSLDNRFVSQTINPGAELQSGSVSTKLPGFSNFKLEDVEFEFQIVEAKNGFEVICN
jgi:hypothetical protein